MLTKVVDWKFKKFIAAGNLFAAFILLFLGCLSSHVLARNGNRPVIVIPAIVGSQLEDAKTGESAWFRFRQTKNDNIALPVSPDLTANKDALVATDILRRVELPGILPDIAVYQDVLDELAANGYREASWDAPQATDAVYVFAYDWRRDNVESAQLLIARIESVKRRLNRPDLQFDIVAHSMGGLVARYAAMYGAVPLPPNEQLPPVTWAGAAHINSVYLFGSPNGGSMSAFAVLLDGYRLGGKGLLPPLVYVPKEIIFTAPSLYQMLPLEIGNRFFDENLKPLALDLYSAETWLKYRWGAIADAQSLEKVIDHPAHSALANGQKSRRAEEKLRVFRLEKAKAFLQSVLARAKKFQQALGQPSEASSIRFFTFGSACKPTLDAVIVVPAKTGGWKTITTARTVKTPNGNVYTKQKLRRIIYRDGDGRVTQSSLSANFGSDGKESAALETNKFFFCEDHDRLLNKNQLQATFIELIKNQKKQAALPSATRVNF